MIALPLSMYNLNVLVSIPESLSVTLILMAGLLFVTVDPAVGAVTVMTGLVFSLTRSCSDSPSVACVESADTVLPYSSSAVTLTS